MANVLQLMNYRAPYPGNFMRSMLALESELGKNGARCLFLFPKGAERIPWINALKEGGKSVFTGTDGIAEDARLLLSLIRMHQVGIIHTHFASARMHVAALAARLAHPEVAYVVHMHNHEQSNSRAKHWVKRAIVNADCYVGVGSHVSADLVAKGYSARKCVTVPNAIDFARLERFEPLAVEGAQRRKKVLMFGFDFHRKGVDVALEALRRYDCAREMLLLIVLARNFEAVSRNIENRLGGIPDWVRLLPPRDDVATYYRMADVFISPSREEGLPYALLEAAFCGVRVVASDIGGQAGLGIPHLLYFRSEDAKALYEALKIATRTHEHARMTEEARSTVIARFHLQKWVEDIMSIYQSVEGGAGLAQSPA